MKLAARVNDDLNWKIEATPKEFEFDLGLHLPHFPIEDQLHFSTLAASLKHFTDTVWPVHPVETVTLYRGSADFSKYFVWSEGLEANFQDFKKSMQISDEAHLKRLFCANVFVYYFQMLAHRLPDAVSIKLILENGECGTKAQKHQLLSPDRFEHFFIDAQVDASSNIGICFPPDEITTDSVIHQIDALIERLPSSRIVYETMLTEQWDGLDELYVIPGFVTEVGERKLLGFEAAGGVIRGRGI